MNSKKKFALQLKNNDTNIEENPHKIKESIKCMYDFLKCDKDLSQGNGLPALIIQDFDSEAIWWQLDSENKSLHLPLKSDILKLLNEKDKLCDSFVQEDSSEDEAAEAENQENESLAGEEDIEMNSDSDDEDNEEKQDDDDAEGDNDDAADEDEGGEEDKMEDQDVKKDQFFSMKQMQKFLDEEDRKAMKGPVKHDSDGSDDESEVDLFEATDEEDDDDDDMQGADIKYKNFFDTPGDEQDQSQQENGDVSDEENEDEEMSDLDLNENDTKVEEKKADTTSSYELRQERLKKKIGHLERAALEEKGWQLKGEITSNIRPLNSLLEEDLDFDVSARPQLVVTAETNLRLEDIILQRIKDKAWDSVKRKIKPVDEPLEFKKKLALNSEKSKESLAQVYEKEYLQEKEKREDDGTTKNEIPPEQIKTTALISNLFSKLDSLSHFYFTPRMVKPEARIISNLPAIQMEEVAPVGVSDATLLAPEEVRNRDKAAPLAKEERTNTDKNRERRKKKVKQHKRRLEQEARSQDLGEARTKKQAKEQNEKLLKMVTKDRNVQLMDASSTKIGKSSDKFFNNLQDQMNKKVGPKKKQKNGLSAKRIKL